MILGPHFAAETYRNASWISCFNIDVCPVPYLNFYSMLSSEMNMGIQGHDRLL